ncbi:MULTISPECIES: glycoside hydrolase family 53 protein [Paraburkholderia]|uniref:Arabinogalactan endo-beta-1,4-galactanase n=2 Tax=Paraburkholderia TaxID=1822464 RepID=A0A7Y9W603_9BURK|nr:arabinogalactan endo-1,4-beta-galactosidase [Paraburkholderia bryophila]NYH14877.1 arabinogalactan endo-1,4-beta-galactosidase [Paraburkholderia bryophila]NYH26793.1 arabinogalactan endo-1,4-beta-galactosidase [Paraburkholderia bryophila]
MNRREMLGWLASAAAATGVGATVGVPAFAAEAADVDLTARGSRFAKGADVSTLLELEANGAKFYEHGKPLDCLFMLRSHGVDAIRIKVWNDPGNPNFFPADQSPAAGYNNAEHVRVLARRAAALGMRVLIDFHYSDWWADPGKQYPPHAWVGKDLAQTCALLSDYTSHVLNLLKRDGVRPEWVQVGNEITGGMLWPLGKYDQWDNLAQLLKAGHDAVKSVDDRIKVMLHLDSGGNNATSRWWFDSATQRGVTFDVIGLSYYPQWQGSLSDLQNNANDMAARYDKDVMVVETAYPWTTSDGDSEPNSMTNTGSTTFPQTPAGQAQFLGAVTDIVKAIPGGRGKGVFWWEPEWIPTPNVGWKVGAGDQWDNNTLFDFHGNALSSLDAFRRR